MLSVGGAPAQQSLPAQTTVEGRDGQRLQVLSPILVVDSERLFLESQLGQTIKAEIEAAGRDLQARNDEIAADLEAEERTLTEQRADMEPEAFRALADAFDEKAQKTRAERAAALQALNSRLEEERRAFLTAAAPVLESIMIEAGAAVVMESRDVFISSLAVDITDVAIARIDAATRESAPEE